MSTSAADVRERPVSRETTYEVEQFLYDEAELLDQWRLHEWLELFTPCLLYTSDAADE